MGGSPAWTTARLMKSPTNEQLPALAATTTTPNSKKKPTKKKYLFGVCDESYCQHFGLLGPGCGITLNSASQEEKHAVAVEHGGGSLKQLCQVPANKQAKLHFNAAKKSGKTMFTNRLLKSK